MKRDQINNFYKEIKKNTKKINSKIFLTILIILGWAIVIQLIYGITMI